MKVAIVWIAIRNGIFEQKQTKVFDNAKDLKDYWKSIKVAHNHYSDTEFHYYTVHRTKATDLPDSRKKQKEIWDNMRKIKSLLWCPYCRDPRSFVKINNGDVEECTICEVSINEYYVKKFNLIGV